MANSKSALKRVRQTKTRTERNKTVRTRMKSLRRRAIEAAEAGNNDEARAALNEFSSAVDRAQKANVVHRNKAANLKAKTTKAVKAASACSKSSW